MQIHDVEQNCAEWYALRSGRPTASEFKKILTGTGEKSKQSNDYAALLAAELHAGTELERWEGNQWTERGHELEAEAKAAYAMFYGQQVETVGFVTNDIAGCSPDGFVGDSGMFEGKALSPHKHVLTLSYFDRKGVAEPAYIPQCQGQMWICRREWVDLFFYHPNLPELKIRVERDDEFIANLAVAVGDVLNKRDEYLALLRRAAA